MDVLTVNGVTKRYGRLTALDGVSLVVPGGAVYGILGPNGSGKTTLLGVVTGALRATSGWFRFFDGEMPARGGGRGMGVLLETPNFYPYLSARENLRVVARIKRVDEGGIPAALGRVGLGGREGSAFRGFSLGMKQRLAIASAILGDPRVVVLDEPTNGLDPGGISDIRHLIGSLAGEGRTVIVASHLLDEVERVCSHAAILKGGRVLASGEIGEVLAGGVPGGRRGEMVVAGGDAATLARLLAGMTGVLEARVEGEAVRVLFAGEGVTPGGVNRFCFERGVVLERLVARERGLEEKFLEITK